MTETHIFSSDAVTQLRIEACEIPLMPCQQLIFIIRLAKNSICYQEVTPEVLYILLLCI